MKSVYHLWIDQARAAPDAPALIDDGRSEWVTHGGLAGMADAWSAAQISAVGGKSLVFLAAELRVETVAAWLGAWKAGAVVALVNPLLAAAQLRPVVEAYQPDALIGPNGWGDGLGMQAGQGDCVWSSIAPRADACHPELGLLLFTSGTTGSPKAVRLRASSVAHNTQSIISSLDLGAEMTARWRIWR